MKTLMFLGFWLVNSVIIWAVGQVVPESVVLGNQHVSPIQASFFAGFMLSTVALLVKPTIELLNVKLKEEFHLMGFFLVADIVSVWIITRLALIIGVGVAVFWWAVVLGLATMLGQWVVFRALKSRGLT